MRFATPPPVLPRDRVMVAVVPDRELELEVEPVEETPLLEEEPERVLDPRFLSAASRGAVAAAIMRLPATMASPFLIEAERLEYVIVWAPSWRLNALSGVALSVSDCTKLQYPDQIVSVRKASWTALSRSATDLWRDASVSPRGRPLS